MMCLLLYQDTFFVWGEDKDLCKTKRIQQKSSNAARITETCKKCGEIAGTNAFTPRIIKGKEK